MRVVSANLYRGRVSSSHLAALLAELRPDIGAFQELTPELGDVIDGHFEHGALYPKQGSSGLGIGACRPVANEVLDLPRRPATVATLDPGAWPELGRATRVLNVHMTHPMVFPPWRSLQERSHQINRIITHADGYDAMVLGDLNAAPGWPVHRRLSRSMDDAARAAAAVRGRRADPTWSLRPAGRALLRIDHVMVRGIRVHDVFTVPLPGSDHRLIVADLEAGT
jgi:endonuclease/exonuclease/phosphatase family metal-dependent hydrolase